MGEMLIQSNTSTKVYILLSGQHHQPETRGHAVNPTSMNAKRLEHDFATKGGGSRLRVQSRGVHVQVDQVCLKPSMRHGWQVQIPGELSSAGTPPSPPCPKKRNTFIPALLASAKRCATGLSSESKLPMLSMAALSSSYHLKIQPRAKHYVAGLCVSVTSHLHFHLSLEHQELELC